MKRAFTLIELLVVVAILCLVGIFAFRGCACGTATGEGEGMFSTAWQEDVIEITVTDKYTAEGTRYVDAVNETFQVQDSSLLDGHWNAADVYRNLKKEKSYRVRVRGYRSGTWSKFRNIVEIEREID